jgi:repressor LexA
MIGISDRQGEMLAFIENFMVENGYPPTREEIRTGLNISTKSLVNYHLEALENAALLTRIPNTPRGLRLSGEQDARPALLNNTLADSSTLSQEEVLELTYGLVTSDNNLYALKVEGDTIVDVQSKHGDVVILQHQTFAQNGEMVAVRLPTGDQAKLKRYYRENGHVRLESANAILETMFINPDAVEIQGKVIALIRQVD